MFDRWDREQDGNIDRFELQQAFGSLGNRVSAEDITSMLRAADTTGDGRIFFPEFCQMMLQVRRRRSCVPSCGGFFFLEGKQPTI